MQENFDAVTKLNTKVVAIAQEDRDLASHGKFLKHFKPKPQFEVVADINGLTHDRFHQTTAYFVDKSGHVREVFPMMIHFRASWDPVLNRIAQLTQSSN